MKAAIVTLGCKVNQYESQSVAEHLEACGYSITDDPREADVCIVNSCTVTSESDRKTRQTVRRLRRLHPDAVILLTGCMPQAYPQAAAALTEADIVVGNRDNNRIPEILDAYFAQPARMICTVAHQTGDPFAPCAVQHFRGRTRAEIKIEDGCDRFCSYCAIPYARGRVRSKPLSDVAAEAALLGDAGYREIVLVGINLSAYRDGIADICDAVEAASASDSVVRVRLGSLEPDHLTDDVLQRLSRCKKICPQFHISLQSGCDNTLRRMNRHYTAAEYAALCAKLRSLFPDCVLTTDVMVGFPGETPEDHAASVAFVQSIGFERAHVFPYSPRGGTRAAQMPDPVPRAEKERRAAQMIRVTDAMRTAYLQSQVGKTVDVLVEDDQDGYTANYTCVHIEGVCPPIGTFARVRITGILADKCIGRIVAE